MRNNSVQLSFSEPKPFDKLRVNGEAKNPYDGAYEGITSGTLRSFTPQSDTSAQCVINVEGKNDLRNDMPEVVS